jgi:hypothetical protein
LQNAVRQNSKDCRNVFRISNDRDHRNNHDYHSSEKSCDNRDNHIQQEAIIVFREKLKTLFRINPRTGSRVCLQGGAKGLWQLDGENLQ